MSPVNVGESDSAPDGSTRIALIVDASAQAARLALRYVSSLPRSATLRLCAIGHQALPFLKAARQRRVRASNCRSPDAAVQGADIVVVFGICPLSESRLVGLASHGVPVEIDQNRHKNTWGRKHAP